LGIYSNFRDHDVSVATAVVHSSNKVQMKNIFTVKLDNIGEIRSIINGNGPGSTSERGVPQMCLDALCNCHIVDNDH
jgi:hypothetical protein